MSDVSLNLSLNLCRRAVALAVSMLTVALPTWADEAVRTGVFNDAPVAGLRYRTSSGLNGLTDARGQFEYRSGDTVIFELGNLTLGQGAASGTLSPADLAAGDVNRASNLYVLLQSLDTQRHADTITLPAQIHALDFGSVQLDAPAGAFGSAAGNPALQSIVQQLGLGHGVVSVDQAKAHATTMFWKQAAGVWLLEGQDYRSMAYLSGEPQPHAPNFLTAELPAPINAALGPALSGVDAGGLVWNPLNNGYLPVAVDADATWRFAPGDEARPARTLRLDGAALALAEDGNVYRYVRHPNDPHGLVGAWRVPLEGNAEDPIFGFLPDGRFVIASTGGLRCAQQDLEAGRYRWDRSSGAFSASEVAQPNAACLGVGAQITRAQLSGDGRMLTLTLADASTLNLERVTR